jgi:hypothetical protein
MAVTSRNLHQAAPRRVVSVTSLTPSLDLLGPILRAGAIILLAYLGVAAVTGWGRIWIDDFRYGRPRTQHISGMVGHNEGTGEPTHFVAMNLNRRVVVVELPGGDAAQARTLQGPYLFGANEDLTPVIMRLHDINRDSQDDLILSVKNEEIIYINTGDTFRLINADERQALTQGQ